MIQLVHDSKKTLSVTRNGIPVTVGHIVIIDAIIELCGKYPKDIIVWCRKGYEDKIDSTYIKTHLSKNTIISTDDGNGYPLMQYIGYMGASPFIKINRHVRYPTWQMSDMAGAAHAETLIRYAVSVPANSSFSYFLNSLSKLYITLGLFCYSDPFILIDGDKNRSQNISFNSYAVFRFIKQHYGTKGIVLLMFCTLIYQGRWLVIPFLYSLFYKRRSSHSIQQTNYSCETDYLPEIDVIIPTIGRKKYLINVLHDLNNQTHIPKNVIVVEQNPLAGSQSELDDVVNIKWNFRLVHIFTNQAGACNARNTALRHVTSEWVFLNDDDNVIPADTIEKALKYSAALQADCVTTAYPQQGENIKSKYIHQSAIFGSGNTFLKSKHLNKVKFDMRYEFGYGEDNDFGMQLRNNGVDIYMIPQVVITHLKAPVGGFRYKPVLAWDNEDIQPKPSPTIMVFKLLHETIEQQNAFKLISLFTYYRGSNKNIISYLYQFNKKWQSSMKWGTYLIAKNN